MPWPTHQLPFLLRGRRLVSGPELLEVGEVAVQGGRVDHQQPGGRVRRVAERVPRTSGNKHERLGTTCRRTSVKNERDVAVENEVGLLVARVPVRRRHPAAGRQGAIHERQPAGRVGRESLEEHLAAPRLIANALARAKTSGSLTGSTPL